jgi:hypothetical protein
MIRVHPDFASRIEQQLDELRARFAHGPAVLDAFRAASASLQPQEVAAWLVREAGIWIPAPCWAVIARDMDGQPTLLAEHGLTPEAGPSMWAVASWVLRMGEEMFLADLASDPRITGNVSGSALGLPLACRGRLIGALVGVDPSASGQPRLSSGLKRSRSPTT